AGAGNAADTAIRARACAVRATRAADGGRRGADARGAVRPPSLRRGRVRLLGGAAGRLRPVLSQLLHLPRTPRPVSGGPVRPARLSRAGAGAPPPRLAGRAG